MAARKPFLGTVEIDDDLTELLRVAKETRVTDEQLHEQRVSFAYGNAPDSNLITKDSVRAASKRIRLFQS